LADPVPDANTIWTFREALKRAGAVEALFARLDATLRASGYLAMGGQIVVATIVAAPKQRTRRPSGRRSRPAGSPEAGRRSPGSCARRTAMPVGR